MNAANRTDMSGSQEPTTPTGRALINDLWSRGETRYLVADILAIEREAAQQERERLRALIGKRLPEFGVGPEYSRDGIHGWRCEYVDRYGPCQCFDDLMAYLFDEPEDES